MCKKCKKHSKKAFVQIPIIMLIASVAALGSFFVAPAIAKVGNTRLAQVDSTQATVSNTESAQQVQPMQPMTNQPNVQQKYQGLMPQTNSGGTTQKRETNTVRVNNQGEEKMIKVELQEKDNSGFEDKVDQQEIQSVTQQLKDMQKEIKNLLTQLKSLPKLVDETAQLNEALSQINTFEQNLKNPSADTSQREVLQEFYDARFWDTINEVRNSFVDPREIKNVLKQVSDLKKQIKTLTTQAKKLANLTDEVAKLNELSGVLDKFKQDINNPSEDVTQRDILQEFYDARHWDEVSSVRMKIEFPKQVKQFEKELASVEKLLKNKTYQKIAILDIAAITNTVAGMRTTINDAKAKFNSGEVEDAMQTLQDIYGEYGPGDINCILTSFRDINTNLPKVKDVEIKASLQDVIDPIVQAVKDEDYRGACQGVNEVRNELSKIMQSASKTKSTLDATTRKKLDNLQQLIDKKFGGQDNNAPQDQMKSQEQ